MDMLDKLLEWSRKNGTKGYDPYDVLTSNAFFRKFLVPQREMHFFKKIVFLFIYHTQRRFPLTTRKLLNIKKKEHPTYLGCMMHAYVNISKGNADKFRSEIDHFRGKLIALKSEKSEYWSWGVPFTWKSEGHWLPEGTGFAVTANWIGTAFLALYKLRGDKTDLDIAIGCCEFILNDLIVTEFENGTICFSYSPVKKDTINNANLFAADLLLSVGKAIENEHYLKMGEKAVDFSVSTQLENGSMPYYANGESNFNDSYHASYEMQCLYRAGKILSKESYLEAFDLYWEYYKKAYLDIDGAPSKYAFKSYPKDVTALADALILYKTVAERKDVGSLKEQLLETLSRKWQDDTGYFYYVERSENSFSKIPYTRWTQGWMALGLSYWYE